jgi:DNA-binding XRE family transcriptional regulator
MTIQNIEIDGSNLVIMTRQAFDALMEKAGVLPPLPPVDQHGNTNAIAFARAAIARKLVSRRIQAGWTQKELAKKAGVRLETISRLEGGKHSPTHETMTRLDQALTKAGV